MADVTAEAIVTRYPSVFDYQLIGTAAGTTTVASHPVFLHALTVTHRKASQTIVMYDSSGTSATVIGTLACGTQTYGDSPTTYLLDFRTKTALTIVNPGDVGCLVSFGK